jgi:hypothetical protein
MRKSAALLIAVLGCAATSAFAANPLQGEIEIKPAGKAERHAGLWLDGQYVGAVNDLGGKGRLALVPGQHELLFKLVGHEDVMSTVTVEPGTRQEYRLAMTAAVGATYPDKDETARLRIDVQPEAAAIFLNDSFVGRSDSFGRRQGMRLSAGTYRVTIALPGYEPFNAELTVRAGQTYEIKTELEKGLLGEQALELTAREPAAAER